VKMFRNPDPTPADLVVIVDRLCANPKTERGALASQLRRLACKVDQPIRGKRDAAKLRDARMKIEEAQLPRTGEE